MEGGEFCGSLVSFKIDTGVEITVINKPGCIPLTQEPSATDAQHDRTNFRGGRLPVGGSFLGIIEGGIGSFGFVHMAIFLDRFFGFWAKRLRFFRFWCSLRFADFSFFSIRFSVFVENKSGFSVLLSNVVCIRFSVLAAFLGGFSVWMIFLRFCGF